MTRNRNRRRRRPLHRRFGKFLAYAVIAVLVVLAVTMNFPIHNIYVEGNRQYEDEKIISVSGIEIGDNMFFIRKGDVSDRLCRELPYISNVSIRHDLPFSIILKVNESAPAALMKTEDGYCILNDEGKVMDISESAPETVTVAEVKGLTGEKASLGKVITVPDEKSKSFDELLKLLSALAGRNLLEEIVAVDLSAGDYMELTYLDRFTVRIPYESDYDYKAKYLIGTVENLEDNEKGLIDMTYPNGEVHFLPS